MNKYYILPNGVKIPKIMIGTYNILADEAKTVFKAAYDGGYRGVDCGRYYGNEKDWGDAVKASGIRRENVFIQTKISHADEKRGIDVIKDFQTTLQNFSTDYIDCLLIHWPNMNTFVSTWKAMEQLYKDGKVRVIGVSNFRKEHFEILKHSAEIMPMVNQIERHPCRHQREIYDYCKENDIQLQAYQPIAVGRPELMNNSLLIDIAEKHACTVPQVALAWNIATKVIPLPRSRNEGRLRENFEALSIELTTEEIERIDGDKVHYFRALREGSEYPGYWDEIHNVDVEKYLSDCENEI
ncbi:MAG: aldo/keto reductase [Lachnospiraceae bacterium]|jgi:diketogulonate reductase-like aldo/keto reductase|nr:aldo/keto reductase [Lachnospiraceae bacterium]